MPDTKLTDAEIAKRLAERLGWEWIRYVAFEDDPENGAWRFWDGELRIPFPADDAPLHSQLAFVGRVLEASGCNEWSVSAGVYDWKEDPVRPLFLVDEGDEFMDPQNPARAAALAVLGGERKTEPRSPEFMERLVEGGDDVRRLG